MPSQTHRDRALRFGVFELNCSSSELRKSGIKLKLQQQPLQLLQILLENAGNVVTREELHKKLWPEGVYVDFDRSLNKAVVRLRETLCDDAASPRFIETLPRHGYRFIAPVEARPAESDAPPPQPPPDRRTRSIYWIAGGLALVLALGAVLWLEGRRHQALSTSIQSIVVLPLENLSKDTNQEYFADGMTDELITHLAKVGSLRVISHNSAMHYKQRSIPLAQIARELNVEAVVEGQVLRSGTRVRITVQLVDTRTDRHLWAETYERDLGDVLALQGEIARSIATEIQAKLTPEIRARLAGNRAVDPNAYDAYLKGRYFLNKRTGPGLSKAVELFQQSLKIDPRYAVAQAGLADAYAVMGAYDFLPATDMYARAKAAASRALEVDGTLAEAHAAMGNALREDWDWPGAEREFQQALLLDPDNVTAHQWYGDYFDCLGQSDKAIAEMKRAQSIDPLSLIVGSALARVYRDARQYDQAVEQSRKTLELDLNFPHAHWTLGLAYLGKGMYREAVTELQIAQDLGRTPVFEASLGHAWAASGDRIRALGVVEELKRGRPHPFGIAQVYAGLGEKKLAMEWLDQAYREHDRGLAILKYDPLMDNVRSEPRFQKLMQRIAVAQ
jgi:TolB-like protein/DNA-binding winged helix-turn-helix (wHTH) protein